MKRILMLSSIGLVVMAGIFSSGVSAGDTKFLDEEARALGTALGECAREYTEALAEVPDVNRRIFEATVERSGQGGRNERYMLKVGYAHPMVGVAKTRQLVIERRFVPNECSPRVMDCGGGNYVTTCAVSEIGERG